MKTKIFSMIILALFSLSLVSGVFASNNCILPTVKEKQLTLLVNENFSIKLNSNPTTGYGWYCNYDPEYIALINESYIPDTHDPLIVGSGGSNVFEFKALKTGETNLTMKYFRPWENCLPREEIIYHIKIIE